MSASEIVNKVWSYAHVHKDEGEGDKIESCTIITTEANAFMQPIHDRMPVILKAELFDSWLNNDEADFLQGLLQPYAETDLEMIPVSHAVNNPRNDSAVLIVPEGMKN